MNKKAAELMKFVDASPTMYHAIDNIAYLLKKEGFKHLSLTDKFVLEPEGKYFVTNNGSAIIAWQMGKKDISKGFRIIGSHSDSPAFKIKPNPEITVKNHFLKLNTEVYGGAILSTWFDRPLSAAGRVIIKSKEILKPEVKLINIDKNLLIIPNLAIHMNRDINEGYTYNKQKDTLPLISIVNEKFEKSGYLVKLLAEELKIQENDILDFDLYLYDRQPGAFVGTDNEFFSVSRIDNLGMAYPSVDALIHSKAADFTQIACVFDNEEVGSATAAGAGSPFLADTLKRIVIGAQNKKAGDNFEIAQQALASSFLISADQAHGLHPNYEEKNDITNFPLLNKGPVIKIAASMSYSSDGISASVFKQVCSNAGVPYQIFVNRSDMRGGSTIGPITAANLNIKCVDIGNPVLAMHSIRELGGCKDQESITKVFAFFYTTEI